MSNRAPAPQRMSTPATIMLVARREFRARFLTKSNLISLGIMVAVIVVGILVLNYFVSQDEDAADFVVGVETQTTELGAALEAVGAAGGPSVEIREMTRAEAEEAVLDDVDAFLSGDPGQPRMLVEGMADPQLLAVVTAVAQEQSLATAISELGGDPQEVSAALGAAAPQVETIDDEDAADQFGPAYLVAVLAISLLLFALISTGSIIAMGVVEEKTSRVVEILLATIRPAHLLAGKILGIGLVGLVQVVLLGAAAFIPITATNMLAGFDVDIDGTMLLLVMWFLLGFAVYSLLFGGFSALVSRQEEIGAVTTPLMFLMFVPFYVSMFMLTSDAHSTAARVLSQVPFFAPFMMPVRNVYGGVPAWEMALSVGITLAVIPLLVWIAGRVYRRGVLHTGGRLKLGEALRG